MYVIKFVTPLPYILLIVTTLLSYLIYKGKLTAVRRQDRSSTIAILLLVIAVAGIAFLVKPYKYNSYIGQYVIPGKMITRTGVVEADEGPNTWEERRTYWQPETKTGETVMNVIGWLNFVIVAACFISCLKFYSKSKEKEDNLKTKTRHTSDFT